MTAIIDNDLQAQELQQLQQQLQQLIAQGANEEEDPEKREQAKLAALELANRICTVAAKGDAPVFLINITRKRWLLTRTYASYWIPGKPKGAEYSSTVIAPATAWRDAGFGGEPFSVRKFAEGWRPKGSPMYYRARMIAADLVREVNGDLPGLMQTDVESAADTDGAPTEKFMGVFMSDSRTPTKEALEAATAKLRIYYAELVREGSFIFERTRDHRMVSALSHLAARELGIETPWHENILDRRECPGCGGKVSAKAAICPIPHCGWILDPDKVREQKRLAAELEDEAVTVPSAPRSRSKGARASR